MCSERCRVRRARANHRMCLRRYTGDWKRNKKHGQGTLTMTNGDSYEGEWQEDKPTGRGKRVYNKL